MPLRVYTPRKPPASLVRIPGFTPGPLAYKASEVVYFSLRDRVTYPSYPARSSGVYKPESNRDPRRYYYLLRNCEILIPILKELIQAHYK